MLNLFRPLSEWRKVRKIFKRPQARVYFGFWQIPSCVVKLGNYLMKTGFENHPVLTRIWKSLSISDPCLPVWRRGNIIHPFNKHTYYNKDHYEWQEDFKKKLEKYHLGWLNTSYELPIWLSVYYFSWDLRWKTKYTDDNIQYEFPPQFTIVLFNISLSIHWHSPSFEKCFDDDKYWTSILHYNHTLEHKDIFTLEANLLELDEKVGFWISSDGGDSAPKYCWVLKPEFLKDKNIRQEIFSIHDTKEKEFKALRDKIICPKCGKKMKLVENKVLPTDPVRYCYKCKCGNNVYLTEYIEDDWYL